MAKMTNLEQAEFIRKSLGLPEYPIKKYRLMYYTRDKSEPSMCHYTSFDTIDEFLEDMQDATARWWISMEQIYKFELIDRDTLESVHTYAVEL